MYVNVFNFSSLYKLQQFIENFILELKSEIFVWLRSCIANTYQLRVWNYFFFSDSHLAPKFFKVVANSKKRWSPFLKTNKTFFFFFAVSILDKPSKIKLGKRSFMCHKVDSRMDDLQPSSSPKFKMASSHQSRYTCCV